MSEELTDANGGGQNTQLKAHGVVLDTVSWAQRTSTRTDLVCHEEEKSIGQDTPDEEVRNNACYKGMSIDSDSTVPVQSNKSPCQRSRNNGDVDESWVGVVAEVERGQVEEVDNQDQFSPDIVTADEEHDECKEEEVVDDEVASYTSGCIDIVGIGGEEGPDISDLRDEEKEPLQESK